MNFELNISKKNQFCRTLSSSASTFQNNSQQDNLNRKRQAPWKDIRYSDDILGSRTSSESQKISLYHDFLDYQENFGMKKRASFKMIKKEVQVQNIPGSYFFSQSSSDSHKHCKINHLINEKPKNKKNNNDQPAQIFQIQRIQEGQAAQESRKGLNHIKAENEETQVLPTFHTSPELIEKLLLKFSLYLQSEYKILKRGSNAQQQATKNKNVFETLINKEIKSFEESSGVSQIKNLFSKVHSFNMSKYFMFFLIRLFDSDHLDQLQINPSLKAKIIEFMHELEKSSQKSENSKTHYYNHNHFDLLFLQLNDQTLFKFASNPTLSEIHKSLFHFSDLHNSESCKSINFFKNIITEIVLCQLEALLPFIPLSKFNDSCFTEIQKRDFFSKIQYFQRVKKSISLLQQGKTVQRF